jgi:hypothetical protein
MDILKITPPFTYSYQCGSTILVSYIPIYMYAISFQIVTVLLKILTITSRHQIPSSLRRSFSGISWPQQWSQQLPPPASPLSSSLDPSPPWARDPSPPDPSERASLTPDSLIEPYQIISSLVNSLILLLTFGLCSPVLAGYILFSVLLTLTSWLYLIGRFLDLRQDRDQDNPRPRSLTLTRALTSITFTPSLTTKDYLIPFLNDQLEGTHRYLIVCKWPILLTSTAFMTLLSWDMAADKSGWEDSLWVPMIGCALIAQLWIFDQPPLRERLERYLNVCWEERVQREGSLVEGDTLSIVHNNLTEL